MRGSLTCRLRHLKCDKSDSKSLRCQRYSCECVPAPGKSEEVSFRHGQNPSLQGNGPPRYGESDLAFPDDQVWVETSSEFDFKDETDQTAAEYYVVSVARQQSASRWSSEGRSTPSSVVDSSMAIPNLVIPYSQLGSRSNSATSHSSTPTPDNQPKLTNINEAYLLRHFQKRLAPWLDACNPRRHFSTDVVKRATTSSLLLYACLAVSACHLSRTTDTIPADLGDMYHERCLSIMLPVLDKSDEIGIDVLISSTVMLRFFEQVSSCNPSKDNQCHLLAGSVYISSHVDCVISGGLATASFWLFVIQDIQFALTYQKCLRLTFAPFDEVLRRWWVAKPVLSDGHWTNRAIWLLAETVGSCWNVSGQNYGGRLGSVGEMALRQRILEWEVGRPNSFAPSHVSPPDRARGQPFPVAWFTSSWHASAIQYVCLAKALMSIRELEGWAPSMRHLEQPVRLKNEIIENLYLIFGIALSADNDPPLRITASHVLRACGSWIDDPLAQNLIFDLLQRTERENGWPLAHVREKVVGFWRRI
ncbi:uncharacterized protein N7446_012625 [Penicillium canescens]|uniref:Zn(II)2Cys6 transcription factor n=1 Tax=Penicillium canescens TaxID=5083 RepID=A0AAD6IA66_PENCN|nr:uncharacterized protein N7446_012625 [Penicillium canescens]KAJ6038816.1 hypothetical protein N7460_007533 [Penicillium canescens]KAJ6045761.1 hypothetical protein N7446_012625 [Penicillium canescens]